MELQYALPVDPNVAPVPAVVANTLELEPMPVGKTRLFVELAGDGLATGIRVPVVVVKGAEPGPTVGITSAIHGNELNGIPVIHRLFQELDPEHVRGTVVGVVAINVSGLHLHQREFSDGTDLNRIMPGKEGGTEAQVYAHRILNRVVNRFDLHLDLHTASFGRVNSLYVRADMTHRESARLAYLQRPQIIVHNAASDGTLRGAAMELGIPSITIEIGDPQLWQTEMTELALRGVRRALAWAGVAEYEHADGEEGPEPVICSSSRWMYTDRGGLLTVYPGLTDRIAAGQHVATVCNAFGDSIREYRSQHDGIVVGKSTNPVGNTGARILHLGTIAPEGFEFLSKTDCSG